VENKSFARRFVANGRVSTENKFKENCNVLEVVNNDRRYSSTRRIVAGLAGACRRSCLLTRLVIVGRLVSLVDSTVIDCDLPEIPVRPFQLSLLSNGRP